jgi:hypothetical protein
MSFDTTTGILTGNPSVVVSPTPFTITATNLSGNSTATFLLTVNSGVLQQISFLTPYPMRLGGQDQVLQGAASSGLPVTYTVLKGSSAVCSLVNVGGNINIHANGVGTCYIDATQAGDGTYAAAPMVERIFSIIDVSANSFLLVIDPNGGFDPLGNATVISQVVTAGTVITLPTLTNSLFTTYSWATGDITGAAVPGPTVTVTSDLVLVANWA